MNEERFAQLLDLSEQRLSADDAAQAVRAGDDAAAAWIRRFHALARSTVVGEPPPELREHLVARFAALRGEAAPATSGVRQRVRAVLAFDSWSAPAAAAGARAKDATKLAAPGGVTTTERHLVYSAPRAEILIDLYSEPDGSVRVEGQFLPMHSRSEGSAEVSLAGQRFEATQMTDDLGQFFFEGVPAGTYEMTLANGNLATIPDLKVGSG